MSLLNLHQFPVTFWKVQKLLSETFDWSKEHLQTVIKDHKICIILNNYWIKVEVSVISRSQRLRLITLTSALIILGITKTESNNRFIIHWTKKKWKSCFCFFTDGKQHKARELDIITRGLECPWHDYCIICRYDVKGADFENSLYAFGQSEKSKSSMHRNNRYRVDHPNKCFTLPHAVLFPIYSYSQIKRQRWYSHLWKCSRCVYSVCRWSLSAPQQGKYQVKTKWVLYIKYVTELLSNECRQTKTKPIRNAYSSAISTWVKISNKQALIVSLCL